MLTQQNGHDPTTPAQPACGFTAPDDERFVCTLPPHEGPEHSMCGVRFTAALWSEPDGLDSVPEVANGDDQEDDVAPGFVLDSEYAEVDEESASDLLACVEVPGDTEPAPSEKAEIDWSNGDHQVIRGVSDQADRDTLARLLVEANDRYDEAVAEVNAEHMRADTAEASLEEERAKVQALSLRCGTLDQQYGAATSAALQASARADLAESALEIERTSVEDLARRLREAHATIQGLAANPPRPKTTVREGRKADGRMRRIARAVRDALEAARETLGGER